MSKHYIAGENVDRSKEEAGKAVVKESNFPISNDTTPALEDLIKKVKGGEKIPISFKIFF